MTTPNGNSQGQKGQILKGETILDQLLNTLSRDDRERVLRLMTELGIPANDPMHPMLVALQYYTSILKDIPEAMRRAAADAFREAIAVYGTIQTNIDQSAAKIEAEVDNIDRIREQWVNDAQALLPEFKDAFDAALQTATAAYRQQTQKIAETSLQD